MDLERELRGLDVEWPPTPPLRLVLAPRRRRRPLYAALALALVALAAAFAVPQSRGAILRFLHVGGETIELVDTLPSAQERALGAGLGPVVPLDVAQGLVPDLLVPDPRPPLRVERGVVSMIFASEDGEVLLSAARVDGAFLKKLAGGETKVEWVQIDGDRSGVWLSGAPHVVFFPRAPARLAGNTLVWSDGRTTYRLEGPKLTKNGALALARRLRYPGKG